MEDKLKELEDRLNKLESANLKETDVVVVLDRSGSMSSNKNDHQEGLQSFIAKQKDLPKSFLTFVQFDDVAPFELVYDNVPMDKVRNISIEPRGTTPLLDAIGNTVAYIDKQNRNRDVIFLIVTDGMENASKEYNHQSVRDLINAKKKNGWQFVFVGTNFDVLTTGSSLGFDRYKNVSFSNTAGSIKAAYDYSGIKFNSYRSVRAAGCTYDAAATNLDFSAEEIEEIKQA